MGIAVREFSELTTKILYPNDLQINLQTLRSM